MALSAAELLADTIAEIGETSLESVQLTGHLAEAESADNAQDCVAALRAALYTARVVQEQLAESLARLGETTESEYRVVWVQRPFAHNPYRVEFVRADSVETAKKAVWQMIERQHGIPASHTKIESVALTPEYAR